MKETATTDTGEPAAAAGALQVLDTWHLPPTQPQETEAEPGALLQGNEIRFDKATLANTPFESLTLSIPQGHHCLILGATRTQRTALSKALQGTLAIKSGTITTPTSIQTLTTNAYIKRRGSLWDQMIFPHDKVQSLRRGVSERHLESLLRAFDATSLLDTAQGDWGRVCDWHKELSEPQLAALAACRLSYHSPQYAVVDADAVQGLIGQLVSVASDHRITLVVLADSADVSLFSRVLEVAHGSWTASAVDGGLPKFDARRPPVWIWDGAREHVLPRRASTLSQCSTTERQWLLRSPGERPNSRAESPQSLTARSSISDLVAAVPSTGSRPYLALADLFENSSPHDTTNEDDASTVADDSVDESKSSASASESTQTIQTVQIVHEPVEPPAPVSVSKPRMYSRSYKRTTAKGSDSFVCAHGKGSAARAAVRRGEGRPFSRNGEERVASPAASVAATLSRTDSVASRKSLIPRHVSRSAKPARPADEGVCLGDQEDRDIRSTIDEITSALDSL